MAEEARHNEDCRLDGGDNDNGTYLEVIVIGEAGGYKSGKEETERRVLERGERETAC